jgi:molybdopterin synthase catalytic subunit
MSNVLLAVIDSQPLDLGALAALVAAPPVGGTAIFVGTVRDDDGRRAVTALSYTAHPTASDLILASAERAALAHPDARIAVAHRVGDLVVGDLAVVVVAGAPHRDEAFAAARMLIDDVKSTVPIWKRQTFADGSEEWVGVP